MNDWLVIANRGRPPNVISRVSVTLSADYHEVLLINVLAHECAHALHRTAEAKQTMRVAT